jgi:hypothetical protein
MSSLLKVLVALLVISAALIAAPLAAPALASISSVSGNESFALAAVAVVPGIGHNNPPRDYVLTFAQWCEVNAISKATGRRILASGEGPPVLQLSLRRLGIRMSDNLAWQQSRIRASA